MEVCHLDSIGLVKTGLCYSPYLGAILQKSSQCGLQGGCQVSWPSSCARRSHASSHYNGVSLFIGVDTQCNKEASQVSSIWRSSNKGVKIM